MIRPFDRYSHPADCEFISGGDHVDLFLDIEVVWRHTWPKSFVALYDALRTIECTSFDPATIGHALYDTGCIGVMIWMTVGHYHGIGLPKVISDHAHVGERTGSRIHMDCAVVGLQKETSGAPCLEERGVSSTSGSEKGDRRFHEGCIVYRVYRVGGL